MPARSAKAEYGVGEHTFVGPSNLSTGRGFRRLAGRPAEDTDLDTAGSKSERLSRKCHKSVTNPASRRCFKRTK